MDMRIPPLKLKIMFESNPLEFRILARRLAVALQQHALHTGNGQGYISFIMITIMINIYITFITITGIA